MDFKVILTFILLVIGNRFISPAAGGTLRLFGKIIRYGNRGSLHGMYKEIFIEKNYLIEQTNKPLTIIDCGSNIGMSILYFRLRAPNANIQGFEPNPVTYAILSENIVKNNLRVTLHNVGLASQPSTATLYTDLADMSSQSASVTKHLEIKRKKLQKIEVKLECLSTYIAGDIDILKLDIEGMEGEVLEELEKTNKLILVKKLFLEYHYDGVNTIYPFGSVLSILERAGFKYVVESGILFPFVINDIPKNISYKVTAWRP